MQEQFFANAPGPLWPGLAAPDRILVLTLSELLEC